MSENCIGCTDSRMITDESIERMIKRIERSDSFHLVDDDTYHHRLESCKRCQEFEGRECRVCGCIMVIMAKLLNTRCLHRHGSKWGEPVRKWM
ncbi:DUF6171 family protein [Paenibacillus guangzhouensis]|uniref:DUF6171 family protein n=1 Tax=Paenibacillus guangzhouensis TaxID=1473112 RepID=UPI001D102A15